MIFERPSAIGNGYRFEVGIKKVRIHGELQRHPLRKFTVDDVSRHLKPHFFNANPRRTSNIHPDGTRQTREGEKKAGRRGHLLPNG
jgi:hypothetical protein